MVQRLAEIIELLLHEQPGRRLLDELGDADRGSVGAVRRAEGVVHVVVGQLGKLVRKVLVIGFFFGVEAQVFEQQGMAFLQLRGHFLGLHADAIGREAHVDAAADARVQQVAQPFRHRLQAHLGIGLALGTAEMRCQHQSRMMADGVFDGEQRFRDAGVVHDAAALVERDVEVHPHEDTLAVEFEVFDGKLCHDRVIG